MVNYNKKRNDSTPGIAYFGLVLSLEGISMLFSEQWLENDNNEMFVETFR